MTEVRLRATALADLDAIWLHIAADDPAAADRFVDEFHERCGRLKDYPRSGPSRPEIAPGIRSLGVGRYLLFYVIAPSRVDIVRVVHGVRDLPTLGLG